MGDREGMCLCVMSKIGGLGSLEGLHKERWIFIVRWDVSGFLKGSGRVQAALVFSCHWLEDWGYVVQLNSWLINWQEQTKPVAWSHVDQNTDVQRFRFSLCKQLCWHCISKSEVANGVSTLTFWCEGACILLCRSDFSEEPCERKKI